MNKREELIQKYAKDLRETCKVEPDMDLLTKVTVGLGPSIYNADSATVASGDPEEMARVRNNFLIKKLGLKDGPDLDTGLEKAVETYGKSNRNKYRAVLCYLLVKHFGKESVYA